MLSNKDAVFEYPSEEEDGKRRGVEGTAAQVKEREEKKGGLAADEAGRTGPGKRLSLKKSAV